MFLKSLFVFASALGLATLEHPAGKLFLGPWFDRLNGDTPAKCNSRFNYKPFSFFQSDVNITSTLQADYFDDIVRKIKNSNTDAIVYLTVYPFFGFEAVSEAAMDDLAARVAAVTKDGRKVFIRYASEMNGSWFAYGQQPLLFIQSWRTIVRKVRAAAGKENVAFVWAPNSGNGYPFPTLTYSVTPGSPQWRDELDTNNNGLFDALDDPYTPYYPGDEWVDWVGMSAYHYGAQWLSENGTNPRGWITNDIPTAGKVENILTGQNQWGHFNFYEMFSGNGRGGQPVSRSTGGHPLMITETAATLHMAVRQNNHIDWVTPANADPASRVQIKRAWWRQLLDPSFLQKYPKVKAISTFEFIKFEEDSWRDFTSLGKYSELTSPIGGDGGDMDGPVLEAFRQDIMTGGLDDLIIWGNNSIVKVVTNANTTVPATAAGSSSFKILDLIVGLALPWVFA